MRQRRGVCKLPEEKFDFLGCTFGRRFSSKTGRAYIGTVRSKKPLIRICETLSEMTGRDQTLLDQKTVVEKLNRTTTRPVVISMHLPAERAAPSPANGQPPRYGCVYRAFLVPKLVTNSSPKL